jgi:uncharacterized surface anchored protein
MVVEGKVALASLAPSETSQTLKRAVFTLFKPLGMLLHEKTIADANARWRTKRLEPRLLC